MLDAMRRPAPSVHDLRAERNKRLAATDFWEVPSVRLKHTDAVNKARDAYRQALRDMFDSCDDPGRIEFPPVPE